MDDDLNIIEDPNLEAYIPASHIAYPKLHRAVTQLAMQFDIQKPAAYVDIDNKLTGKAFPASEAIAIAEDVYDALTESELKALAAHEIKHLYHGTLVFPVVCPHRYEYDADRASVDATDIKTALSSQHKLDIVQVERWPESRTKDKTMQKLTANSDAFPKETLGERIIRFASHPSNANRAQAMEDYWQSKILDEQRHHKLGIG